MEDSLDSIIIKDLSVTCIIGILPDERVTPQPLSISVIVKLDLLTAAQTEQLTHTIDYYELAQDIKKIALDGKFHLLERLAETIASHVLSLNLVHPISI